MNITEITNLPISLLIVGGFLLLLLLIFLFRFLIPGLFHYSRLCRIQKKIRHLQGNVSISDIEKIFSKNKRLHHLWKEYQETLHKQFKEEDGRQVLAAVRATIPAEVYFNDSSLVDSWLETEFFKHLPGIFTGLGIIGTFIGLINGLKAFEVVEDVTLARSNLEALMHAVGEAFLISAIAIISAMIVTFLERMLIASLYRRSEEISHAIDACFDAGSGEEYLSRLVKASEDSASQSKILKDALVKELGDLLRELTSSQIEATRQGSVNIANTINESITESFKEPLKNIANTVKAASGDQSSAAVSMLNDVMVSFSQRLNDLFGGQINNINELNNQTAQGVQSAVKSLNLLVEKLEESGKNTAENMAQHMAASIKSMEEKQEAINKQTLACIEQVQHIMANSQDETQQQLQTTLESMGQQMSDIMTTLSHSQDEMLKTNQARENQLVERNSNLINTMTEGVEEAVQVMTAASKSMSESVAILSSSTTASVDKMNAGAERLNSAAANFATAGDRVNDILNQTTSISEQLTEVSKILATSSDAISEVLHDYRAQRDAVSQLLAEVKIVIETAKKEASLNEEVLQRIEQSASKLGLAQKAADEYLDGVNKVLAESNESFQSAVINTLGKVNSDFHEKLSSAVGLLHTAIEELETSLAEVDVRQ